MAKVLVWSVVLYGSETWTVRQEDIRSLEAFEMWICQRMMKIPWTQHASNEQILGVVDASNKQILGMVNESHFLLETEKTAEKLDEHVTRLLITEGHRRKVSRKENSRKTKNNVIGFIDARRRKE